MQKHNGPVSLHGSSCVRFGDIRGADAMSKIVVSWEAWDGYICGKRPQKTSIDLSEFEADMDVTAIEDLITMCVDDDFEQKIMPSVEADELSRCTDAVLEYLAIERGE